MTVSRSLLFRSAAVAALILIIVCPSFSKRKDDVVIMKNGDTFTGEIKGLQYGELIFKSDYMKDSVHLDWKRVEVLESKDTYIVALSDGQRITGLIKRARVDGGNKQEFTGSSSDSAREVSPQNVITIDQREASFWNQLTGSVDYGFSLASDNHSTNSSLGAEVAFNTINNSIALATSSQFDSHRRMPRIRTGSPSTHSTEGISRRTGLPFHSLPCSKAISRIWHYVRPVAEGSREDLSRPTGPHCSRLAVLPIAMRAIFRRPELDRLSIMLKFSLD